MAIIYWKLGHLTAPGLQRPLNPFVVFREGLVFDVDSLGWDRGIRPGQNLSEMKWRHPGAVWVPWRPQYYQKLLDGLQEWLQNHAAAFNQSDPREGWWEWPRLTRVEWHRLTEQIVPRWAQRIEAGVASHPWLAHWIAEEGAQEKVPLWDTPYCKTYVLYPGKESQWWPRLPLRYMEDIPEKTRQWWHKRRWERVGDVPGLLPQIRPQGVMAQVSSPDEYVAIRRFDHPVSAGVGEVLGDMAEELAEVCRQRNAGIRFLRLSWFRDTGVENREREWPVVAGDAKTVNARVLSLLGRPPAHPFDEVALRARLESVELSQMEWWNSKRAVLRPGGIPAVDRWPLRVTRREQLLQYWDPWRLTRGDQR